ncbi:helicase-related protein [Limosilactobacillus fermentum]
MAADNQLNVGDIGNIIGVWNAMVKRNGITGEITGAPMKRAIAFTDSIKHSKILSDEFESVVNEYLDTKSTESFSVDVKHVDGGLNALQKEEALDWLADDDIEDNHARILSNVKFLTEGIDVPNLDAIIFFSPKKSQVDIVQAVGRIMRRAEGKEYGYIILPIVVADGVDPKDALDNDKKYKQVWQVLNALRSTDERFDAEVNHLDLNKKKDGRINFTGVNSSPDGDVTENNGKQIEEDQAPRQLELPLNWREMQTAFYGKVVQKVGDRRYLEDWSKDVSDIAKMYIRRINDLIESNDGARSAFDKFLTSLHHNINDSIDKDAAIQMLAQHLITEPIFNALFGDYDFVKNNVVSKSLNEVITTFKIFGFEKEQEQLRPFYESVKLRASGIDNAAGKQKLIVTLYDKFFSTGFKDTTEQLGIVFTPVEVVDFIIHSVDDVIQKYFGKHLADKGIHILDPFTGTGTFITRTLQYLKQQMDAGQITFDDILRKYLHELHANEIVLLSYYIAAVNIETVFDEVNGSDRGYKPFDGIVLTDTFESTERQDSFIDELLGQNNERLKEQQKQPITAIISNPPYSVGAKDENLSNKNVAYPRLDALISNSYVKESHSKSVRGLYDSYIRAFKWASTRINNKGIIGFVTNGSYLDSSSTDGLRASLYKEFNHLYIFNLRGDARTQGEKRRKEKDNVFGQGTRTPVAISILVKDGSKKHEIYYHDIGDYLTRKQKLALISKFGSISNIQWKPVIPDLNNDWINKRDPNYKKYSCMLKDIFYSKKDGVQSNRDAWVINFSRKKALDNSHRMISHYNQELRKLRNNSEKNKVALASDDTKYISWSRRLKTKFNKGEQLKPSQVVIPIMYYPFVKKWLYFDRNILEYPRKFNINRNGQNTMISVSGAGSKKPFSTLVTKWIPNYNLLDKARHFELNVFEKNDLTGTLDVLPNITCEVVKSFGLSKEDLAFYIYGILNSGDYRQKYKNDLVKGIPRIPLVKNRQDFIKIGKLLMHLHLDYENVEPYGKVTISYNGTPNYSVRKMKFAKKRNPETGNLEVDRSTIIYNDFITISSIPEKAYDYIVNGKSAIEWIMDQYQVTTDDKSGITDDPNDFSDDPKYIFNLLLRIINVSVQTVNLINQLPKLEIDESYYKDKR